MDTCFVCYNLDTCQCQIISLFLKCRYFKLSMKSWEQVTDATDSVWKSTGWPRPSRRSPLNMPARMIFAFTPWSCRWFTSNHSCCIVCHNEEDGASLCSKKLWNWTAVKCIWPSEKRNTSISVKSTSTVNVWKAHKKFKISKRFTNSSFSQVEYIPDILRDFRSYFPSTNWNAGSSTGQTYSNSCKRANFVQARWKLEVHMSLFCMQERKNLSRALWIRPRADLQHHK